MAAPRWHDDGWDVGVRIGVLVPHADVGPESETRAMAPRSVSIHATRVPFGAMAPGGGMDPTIALEPVRRFAEQPELDDAAELLAGAPLDAIAYGFTSSAYVNGGLVIYGSHGGSSCLDGLVRTRHAANSSGRGGRTAVHQVLRATGQPPSQAKRLEQVVASLGPSPELPLTLEGVRDRINLLVEALLQDRYFGREMATVGVPSATIGWMINAALPGLHPQSFGFRNLSRLTEQWVAARRPGESAGVASARGGC